MAMPSADNNCSHFQEEKIDEKNQSNSAGSTNRTRLCRCGEGGEYNVLRFGRLLRILLWVQEVSLAVEEKRRGRVGSRLFLFVVYGNKRPRFENTSACAGRITKSFLG